MDSIDREDIEDAYNELMDAFDHFQRLVLQHDKQLFLKWKAGGFIVDDGIVTEYGNAVDVYAKLMQIPVDDEDEDDYNYDTETD